MPSLEPYENHLIEGFSPFSRSKTFKVLFSNILGYNGSRTDP